MILIFLELIRKSIWSFSPCFVATFLLLSRFFFFLLLIFVHATVDFLNPLTIEGPYSFFLFFFFFFFVGDVIRSIQSSAVVSFPLFSLFSYVTGCNNFVWYKASSIRGGWSRFGEKSRIIISRQLKSAGAWFDFAGNWLCCYPPTMLAAALFISLWLVGLGFNILPNHFHCEV